MKRAWRLSLLLVVLTGNATAFPQAKSLKAQLEALKGKVLTLRNFGNSEQLLFDVNGLPKQQLEPGSWTLYAEFGVKHVSVNDKHLTLSGPRIIHHYDTKQKKMELFRSNRELEVQIDLKAGATSTDVSAVLQAVFINHKDLSLRVPGYWRDYLEGHPPSLGSGRGTQNPTNVATNTEKPKPILAPAPRYPEEARRYRFDGVVAFRAEITEAGNVGNLMIMSPAGAGLDEVAADAVYKWKYAPLIVDGKPTPFVTTVTVNFSFAPQ